VNNIQVVFNPEFLTEANAINDFKNQNRIILGGPRPATSILKTLFSRAFPKSSIVKTGSNTAEMVKYFTNCFLASKVSFSNEMRQICESSKIDYDKVVEYALYDQRIGKSHLSSPGPDGSYGFGGHCFPKDINALMFLAREKGVNPAVLQAVWDKNLEVRSEEKRDWEAMSGRAVSED
jgi:UDPglucose 6-dehydrogenase